MRLYGTLILPQYMPDGGSAVCSMALRGWQVARIIVQGLSQFESLRLTRGPCFSMTSAWYAACNIFYWMGVEIFRLSDREILTLRTEWKRSTIPGDWEQVPTVAHQNATSRASGTCAHLIG